MPLAVYVCLCAGIRNIEVSLSYVFLEILLMIPSVLLSVASLAMWIEICILVSRQISKLSQAC